MGEAVAGGVTVAGGNSTDQLRNQTQRTDSLGRYVFLLEAAGTAAGSPAAIAGATGAGQGGSFSSFVLGEGGAGRDYSFRTVMAMRTGSSLSSLTERA